MKFLIESANMSEIKKKTDKFAEKKFIKLAKIKLGQVFALKI